MDELAWELLNYGQVTEAELIGDPWPLRPVDVAETLKIKELNNPDCFSADPYQIY